MDNHLFDIRWCWLQFVCLSRLQIQQRDTKSYQVTAAQRRAFGRHIHEPSLEATRKLLH